MTWVDFGMNIAAILDAVCDLFFPNRCGFCGAVIEKDRYICSGCYDEISFCDDDEALGMRLSEKLIGSDIDGCCYAADYDGIVKRGILRLKRNYAKNTARFLCIGLSGSLAESGIIDAVDVVISVPISKKRKAKSGYNHSDVIAKYLCSIFDKPYLGNVVAKKNLKYSQHEQSSFGRMALADISYVAGSEISKIAGMSVLLCDDILTTGSTVKAISKLLKQNGAAKVYVAALASTGKEHKQKD